METATEQALHWVPADDGESVFPPGFRPETRDIIEQFPDVDSDMVRHYVVSQEVQDKWGPILGRMGTYGKEALDLLGTKTGLGNARGGFSLDDLLANEAGMQGRTPQEAYDAGVFHHTEPGVTGFGQGRWDVIMDKAADLDLDLNPFTMPHEATSPSGPSTRVEHRPPPDYNLMDRLSAAYQYLAPTSSADPSRQQEAAEVLFRESEASPEVREEALRIAPSAVLDAIRNRDISRLPTYEPIIPAFAGGSISIPEELPSNIPFPESVENLTAAVTADPIVSAPPQEEVSEERVKVIKKKPKEKRTSVEEQVVVASEVKKALDNASKGKKVKNELKAIVELAKVDPTIVARYTTPGSQALQDITAQVDSFSFMPTIQKKKKTVDPWAFEDRRGGRR